MDESKVDIEDLLCPVIASWILLPGAATFILSIHYILEISGILLYIIIGVFSVCFPLIAILVTLGYKFEKLTLFKIAYYITIPFIILGIIFFFGFFIFCAIYLFRNLSDFSFMFFLKAAGVFFPFGITLSMLFNVFTFNKNNTSESLRESDNQDVSF